MRSWCSAGSVAREKPPCFTRPYRCSSKQEKSPAKNILFVNCDEPAIPDRTNALSEAVDTYRREIAAQGTIYLLFDEVQAVENWEREIKSLYDRKQCKIIISGSSSYLLDSQVSTLLSGRYFIVPVYPLDFAEYLRFHEIIPSNDAAKRAAQKYEITTHLRQYLHEGGFPVVVLQQDERTRQDYLKAYYDSIVYRDIVRTNVGQEPESSCKPPSLPFHEHRLPLLVPEAEGDARD